MTPGLFANTSTADEWHLCNTLGKAECLKVLENHWYWFYTRDDFVQIKNAGLNAVRIPLGYWAVDLLDYEPYVSGQYPYLIRAVQWAQQLGLNVFLDLHGAPGSQNGWEETGLVGPVLFNANTTNTNRSLNVLRNLTKEFSQPHYGGVVTNIELLNEPLFGIDLLKEFYTLGAPVVNVTGINVTIHDGFYQPHTWENYDPSNANANAPAPHLTVDTHQFWGFPPLNILSKEQILTQICELGQELRNNSAVPYTLVGEWSLDTGITANSTSAEGEDQAKRTWFRQLFEAQNAAFTPNKPGQATIGWYFWAWKTEYDIDTWSYRKGLQYGYIPSNVSDESTYIFPRLASGCIDTTFDYTAPATVSSTASATAGPSGSSIGNPNNAASTTSPGTSDSSSTAKSSACSIFTDHWLKRSSWVAIAAVTLFYLC